MLLHRLLAFALLVASAVAGEITVTGKPAVWNPDGRVPPPLRPPGRMLELRAKKPDGAVGAPKGSIHPLYATIEIAGKTITVLMSKSDKEQRQPDRLLIDLHGNGTLQEVELKLEERPLEDGSTAYFRSASMIQLRIAGRDLPVSFLYRGLDEEPYDTQFAPLWYLEATIDVGGSKRSLYVQDADLDGKYDGAADLWFMALANQRAQSVPPSLLSPIGAGRFVAGHRVVLSKVDGNQLTVRVTAADGPSQEDLVTARKHARTLWHARLADARASDEGSPSPRQRAKQQVPWRYLSLAEARALGKKEKKPLFVDLLSLASGDSYRVDYYTYGDEEVRALLVGRFVPVRVVLQEGQASFREFAEALGARKLPSMGVIHPDGKPTQLIAGWKDPVAMMYALRTALGEKVKRDWSPFFGEFPFVVGYEAGMKEAKFTGRPPMLFSVSFDSAASRKFAQRSFTMKLAGKLLDHYTPVLIDVDADKRITKQFPVLITSPSIAWIDFDGEQIFMNGGDVPLYLWEELVTIPVARAPQHPVPAGYTALLKLRDELRAALKADDSTRALKAIEAIERVGQGARVQAEAAAAKKKLKAR